MNILSLADTGLGARGVSSGLLGGHELFDYTPNVCLAGGVLEGPSLAAGVLEGITVAGTVLEGPVVAGLVLEGPTVAGRVLEGPVVAGKVIGKCE